MEKILDIQGYAIAVVFKESSVHINNNAALWDMLNAERLENTHRLVTAIQETFSSLNGRALDISETSLMVEIWGHVYIDYFARSAQSWLPDIIVAPLVDKIGRYCAVIDCGEKGSDSNRFLWDMLSGQVTAIDKLLPDVIDTGKLQ